MDSDEELSDEALSMESDEVLSDEALISENAEEGIPDSCAEEPLLLSDLEDGQSRSPPSWAPGRNTGHWLGWAAPIGQQAQVLIANVIMCLKQVPAAVLRRLRDSLPDFHYGKNKIGLATQIGARLLGLSVGTASSMVVRLRTSEWQPLEPTMPSARGGKK